MKTTPLVALALSAACLALPATANAAGRPAKSENQTSGVGEFWIGYNFLSEDNVPGPIDDGYPGLGGAFRFNIPAGGALNFQVDLQAESGFVSDTNKNYTGSVLSGGHLSWRNPSEWLVGGFAGVGNGFNANDETATAWLLGAEGQYYLSDWTLYGQLGYMDAEEANSGTPDAFRNAWFGRGVARFFLDSNVKLQGEVSYASGENDIAADDMDIWGWGLRYERTMHDLDANLFVAYDGNRYASDETSTLTRSATEHTIKLGLSFNFGIEGQKYIDRQGATLDLPMVTRWSAYGVDVVN
ncbi:MAG: hypothetical protein K8S25_17610 [Alphaproteobacteria bacterium]|nr:hypothetical protein [Alphaproteobacteria bacterium]